MLDNTQPSRTKVLSLTCTPAEESVIKRLSAAKEEPVAHLLRRHLDWASIRGEYDRLRAVLGYPAEDVGQEVGDAGELGHAPKVNGAGSPDSTTSTRSVAP